MKKNLESIFNVVLGTAGHIDHGKSTLVKTLTGVDPDRLPEEKARGLTIDLGFAPLVLRSGLRVGVVDVPGHERLIKNMVAGATGIDLVLLVVAADDGVMPQTREHLTIMQILGLEHGIVVITKVDMVDAELRELVREEVKEALAGTFLESAPVAEVSSVTGEGIEALLDLIHDAIAKVRPRRASGIFRMPIQRVFSPKGFGTVVTGIPLSGRAALGDTLEIMPLGQKGRVRGIHAYKEATDLARAGHSSAINLSDIDYREVHRGMVLTEPGFFRGSTMYEARLHYLPASRRPLQHQTEIRLHVGTAEALGKVFLLEEKTLESGEESFVQFRLAEPLVAAPGDRYVLRLHSPMETIGGGEILDQSRWRLKTGKRYVIEELRGKQSALGDSQRFLLHLLASAGYEALSEKDLSVRSGLPAEELRPLLEQLLETGDVVRASRPGLYLSAERLEEARSVVLDAAAAYYRQHPRRLLMDKTHLRQAIRAHEVFLQDLIGRLEASGELAVERGTQLRWRDHGPRLTAEEESRRGEIAARCLEQKLTPPSPEELAQEKGWDPAKAAELFELLAEEGELLKVAEGIYFHQQAIEEARERLREHLLEHGAVTAGDAKNLLGSTRKYCIPLLEHFDREGFTVRRGDLRELKK
jgi:selenocysteine-specific elongation factor